MKKEIKIIEEVRKSAQFEIKRELFYWGISDIDMLSDMLTASIEHYSIFKRGS